jgi:hypothetical protein
MLAVLVSFSKYFSLFPSAGCEVPISGSEDRMCWQGTRKVWFQQSVLETFRFMWTLLVIVNCNILLSLLLRVPLSLLYADRFGILLFSEQRLFYSSFYHMSLSSDFCLMQAGPQVVPAL